MRSRSNGGVIGTAIAQIPGKSGVFNQNETTVTKQVGSVQVPMELALSVNPTPVDSDPYYSQVLAQFGDTDANDWILRDRSGNNWHETLAANSYARMMQSPTYSGPRYTDWCTIFHDDGYYTVTDTTGIQFGTGNFTIEFWFKPTRQDATQYYLMGRGGQAAVGSGTGWTVFLTSTYRIGFYSAVDNVTIQNASGTVLNRDQWYHIVICRLSRSTNGTTIYVNGVADAQGTIAGSFVDSSNLYIGRDRVATAATFSAGRFTDIRIMPVAMYSVNFTPPSGPLDMTGAVYSLSVLTPHHDNNFNSQPQGKVVTITGSTIKMIDSPFVNRATKLKGHGSHSVWFGYDGGGCLKATTLGTIVNTGTSLTLGTSAFTVEAWVQYTTAGTAYSIMGVGAAAQTNGWDFKVDGSGNPVWVDGTTTLTSAGNAQVKVGGWYHVAAVRHNTGANGFNMYVNGIACYTGTVATSYALPTTNYVDLFAAREQANEFYGLMTGLRVSTADRYPSGNFTVFYTTPSLTAAFIDSAMSTGTNVSLLMLTTGDNEPRPGNIRWIDYGTGGTGIRNRTSEVRYGQHHAYSRTGFCHMFGGASQYTRIRATTTQSDFNFGTGDFSIEFWAMNNYQWEAPNGYKGLFDTRSNWNDTGIMMQMNYGGSVQVISNNTQWLNDTSHLSAQRLWIHYCVQRVNGQMALYVNGQKVQEVVMTLAINSTANQINIGNHTYPNCNYGIAYYGWISDFRVNKGTAAYAAGLTNPDTIVLPTNTGLKAVTGTVLLTMNQPVLGDYSGRNNYVDWDYGNNQTNTWDHYNNSHGPYPAVAWDRNKIIYNDTWDSNSGWLANSMMAGDGARHDHSFMTRFSKPWTLEFWVYLWQSAITAGTASDVLFTANSAGHEGWQLLLHYGNNAFSYGNVSFKLWTASNSGSQYLFTTNKLLKGHSWNYITVQFDPTKTNQMSLWVNGTQSAVRTTAFSPQGTKTWNTYRLQSSYYGVSTVRISDVARYNADTAPTHTIPTSVWTYDTSTVLLSNIDGPFVDKKSTMGSMAYGIYPSTVNKKYGTSSMRFNNKDSGFCDRLLVYNSTWNTVENDLRRGDFTVEMWAQWWDLAAGGRAYTSTGNALLHFANHLILGAAGDGTWVMKWGDTSFASGTKYNTASTTVPVSTTTSGKWDYVVWQRRNRSYELFVNGVLIAQMPMAANGTYTAGTGPTTSNDVDFYSNPILKIGCPNDETSVNAWTGYVQDFRWTTVARYQARIVNGVSVMTHVGTNTPAVPVRPHPTR